MKIFYLTDMKTLILIMSTFFACTFSSVGQNYMGMNQSRILKDLGEPDEIGDRYIMYKDLIEEGENIYYFNTNDTCISFLIVRNNSYLEEYQKMLKSDFTKTAENQYSKKTRKLNYLAELTQSSGKFQILIHQVN
jgi:hypothetical protein